MKNQLYKLAREFGGIINGKENLDPVPLAVELGIEPEDPIEMRIQKLLGSRYAMEQAQNAGFETIDEANDFDVNGEDEFVTPYETVMMVDEVPSNTPDVNPDPVVEAIQPTTPENASEAVTEAPVE